MKKTFILIALLTLSLQLTWAQTAPDFTFTDVHGETHNLQHTLDQGFIVLLDFFFVDCPPCQATAPDIQSIHEDYQGKNVIIFSISHRDEDSYIDQYKSGAGLTYISGGIEGGGDEILTAYATANGFSGFPTFSVICNDGSISWNINVQSLRDCLETCGVVDSDDYLAQSATAIQSVASLQDAFFAPNPSRSLSRLQFELTTSTNVTMSLMNAQGALVQKVFNGQLAAGIHNFDVDLTNLATGSYWLRIQNAKGQTTSMPVQKI